MHIHQIGPLPPPYGGVSVHISRLRRHLLRAGHDCTTWCQYDRLEETHMAERAGDFTKTVTRFFMAEGHRSKKDLRLRAGKMRLAR